MASQLEKVHRVQLDLALEVKRICEKHNINYFLIAGTLLGAVRHGGFIPWDDDLDIGMKRDEYERFITISNSDLNSKYFLQTWDTDGNFGLPIAKIRVKGTTYTEKNSSETGGHNGIYIDIFPFDNVPKSTFLKLVQNLSSYILKRMILVKVGYKVWSEDEFFKKIIYKIVYIISGITTLNNIKKFLYKSMTKYNKKGSSEFVVTFGGSYGYVKETIKREWIEKLNYISFENQKFFAPLEYKKYLSNIYGDYMTPPPIDKRENRHGIIEIDLGDFE